VKDYLVDVPVAIQAFIRPDMLKKQWEVIKQARPSILFIRSDGPRETVPSDKELVEKSRKITEDVDWNCTVYRLYQEKNLGLYALLDVTNKFIWEHVDRCVYLEDDQIPSVSFFRFCAEMLEKYKDDYRVNRITGVNLEGVWEKTSADYFFAKVPTSSGVAIWKRTIENNDVNLDYAKDPFVMKNLQKILPWYLKKQFNSFAKKGTFAYHKPGGEFFTRHAEYCQNQLIIVPKYNLMSNIGVGDGSTHTASKMKQMPKALQSQYHMKTYELDFPLNHPKFVMADYFFEKEREKKLGVKSKTQRFFRNIERIFRLVFFGGFSKITSGIKRKVKKTVEK